MTTLQDVFRQSVQKYPNKEALVDMRLNKRWTFQEWDKEANQLAQAFKEAGVQKGDRVSTVLYNTSEFVMTFVACIKLGAIFNPINFRLTEKEIEFILADASPKIVVFEKAVRSEVQPLIEHFPQTQFWYIDEPLPNGVVSYYQKLQSTSSEVVKEILTENDDYAIMYTSGTTGKPKGVVHSHRDMVDQSTIMIGAQQLTSQDRGLSAAPLFHCAEMHCVFIPRLHIGATSIIVHHFDPEVVMKTIQSERVNSCFLAPTMWSMLVEEKNKMKMELPSLEKGLYGGAPMAPALVKQVYETLNIKLFQAYGMTEMGPAITVLFDDEQLEKAGSAGKPLINHEIRVIQPDATDPEQVVPVGEQGEVIVRGPSMMSSYYRRPEATKEVLRDGWYFTGDVGYTDEDGYLWVNDRIKDMIVSGGENIYSREVEDTLFDHPEVLDVAVIGEPDEKWGERVVAFVVLKNSSVTEEELDDFCKKSNRLANYKRPRRYEFVNELPRNASGKLQKFKLREQMKSI
ncbi:fatty acid--CoA ligase [Aliibacillus thermotolerans]|uniref:Fatty acid--CoA ligase n=1 Tax=Aliibacillus thermotolerans TaxID=1834418 RepID=A0ABW0U3R2_9BACI|nr:fatty acid--CoA ligase [Aliibacillus thermotolerans]MDA3128802.1 long-chain-fatty-acid--CoA ligase [Aliibacillus thermotolerans]